MRKRLKTMELVRGLTSNYAACLDCGENAKAASLCSVAFSPDLTSQPQVAANNRLMHPEESLEECKGCEPLAV